MKLLKRLTKKYEAPCGIITDGLRAYLAAMNEIACADRHEVGRGLNNRPHLVTREVYKRRRSAALVEWGALAV